MTRLHPPTRQVPPGAKNTPGKSSSATTTTTGRSKLQIMLMITIGMCVVLTLFVNIKSTSASVLEGLHYGAAVTSAIEEFKRGGALGSSMSGTKNPPQQQGRQQREQLLRQQQHDQHDQQQEEQEEEVDEEEGENERDHQQQQQQQEEEEEEEPPSEPKTANTDNTPTKTSEIASLSCAKHGGPPDEAAQEMVYWSDIPSDSLYVSPLRQKRGSRRQYMTFEPDGGGWNVSTSKLLPCMGC